MYKKYVSHIISDLNRSNSIFRIIGNKIIWKHDTKLFFQNNKTYITYLRRSEKQNVYKHTQTQRDEILRKY